MSEEIKVVEVERRSWYNNPEGFDKWRVFPAYTNNIIWHYVLQDLRLVYDIT